MATAGPKHVKCFMYYYIKQVTLGGASFYFNTKQCDGSKCLCDPHSTGAEQTTFPSFIIINLVFYFWVNIPEIYFLAFLALANMCKIAENIY
jgi:hypothetical protein